jgi:dTDP-4-amino-4,6-dideoxygalactose transaminase
MSELHASLALLLLDRVDDEILARRRLLQLYREQLAEIGGLKLQKSTPETAPNGAYCTVEVDSEQFGLPRDQLFTALRAENIVARRYFWPLCSDNELYRESPSARPELLPSAHRVAGRILCLPLHGEMSADQVDLIVDRIRAIRSAAPAVARATPN